MEFLYEGIKQTAEPTEDIAPGFLVFVQDGKAALAKDVANGVAASTEVVDGKRLLTYHTGDVHLITKRFAAGVYPAEADLYHANGVISPVKGGQKIGEIVCATYPTTQVRCKLSLKDPEAKAKKPALKADK